MLDLVAKRNWFYLFSALILIPGAISLLIPPRLKPGIEFTGGTTFSFTYAQPATSEQVKSLLSGLKPPKSLFTTSLSRGMRSI